jgi:hypothetical protein
MTAAPVYLVLMGFFSMNAFDLLFRTLAFYVLTVIVRTGNAKLFALMGFILGLGLLSKIGVLFPGSGLALGLMLTPARGYPKSGYLWGPGDRSGGVAIALGVDRRTLMDIYEEVMEAAVIMSPYGMPWETNRPVYVCRGLKIPLTQAWRMTKSLI